MRKKLLPVLILAVSILITANSVKAQTQFWGDNFEDAGSPSSGSRAGTISDFTCASNTHYFLRATPATFSLQNGSYSGFQGLKIYAFEDIDYGSTCTNNSISFLQRITWTNINIAGKTGLTFKGLFAADNVSFQSAPSFPTNYDLMEVEYRIDGGAWTKIVGIYANSSSAGGGPLAQDNNGDLVGDGTPLTYAFSEISGSITGTGTTLELRFNVSSNVTVQEMAIDNFRLFETVSCVAPTITSQPPLTRTICAGNSTTFNISAAGATAFKWQVDPTGGGSYSDLSNIAPYSGVTTNTLTITGVTAGMHNYRYRCVAINGVASCFTNSSYGTLTISNSYQLPTSTQTVTQSVGNNYANNTCELVNSVAATGTNPITGNVTNKVWIESGVPTQASLPFVQQHYEITPANNPSTATGTVTLYFTQTEFNNFNAAAGSTLDLPANSSDAAGKANLRIGKYSGVSGDGSGLPSSYSSTKLVIDPDDNNITWNTVSSTWEVTFNVDGFSGFIVQTSNFTLPVSWTSFTASKQDNGVLINWSTASEQNTKDFTVQHRNETGAWTNLSVLSAAGNSSSSRSYSYFHTSPVKGINFYRVMQTDLDGKTTFTEIKTVNFTSADQAFTIMTNPVVNGVLKVQVNKPGYLSLFSAEGKLIWKKQVAAGLLSIPIGTRSAGVYSLQGENESRKIIIQ